MYNVRVRRRPRLLIVRRAQPNSPASPERRGGGKGAGWYTRLQAAKKDKGGAQPNSPALLGGGQGAGPIKEVQSPGRTIACPCAQAGTPAHTDNLFI